MSQWIDITRPMDESLITWPGRAQPKLSWEKRLGSGGHCNVSFWELSAHSGTHMDAPLHFVGGGISIDQIAPETFIGECQVVDLATMKAAIMEETLARRYVGVKRLLINTRHKDGERDYEPHGPLMTTEAAALLLEHGLILIGTDRLSVDDSQGNSFTLHHAFLGAGCVILEGLQFEAVQEGSYFLYAAPLRFAGAEASPVRALLKKLP
ncbi:MAG TPA: cyclase family protein [Candidatus Eisenbacteria bacterium]|nr:cyclase family protein [Candidatus Eisenbacteria bacterium]